MFFLWTIDMDAGVLVNAAREGLGNEIAKQTIDMSPFYFKGINVQGGNRPPVAAIDGPLEAFAGDTVHFGGQRSNDPDGDALTYRWSASGLPFDGATTVEVDGVSADGWRHELRGEADGRRRSWQREHRAGHAEREIENRSAAGGPDDDATRVVGIPAVGHRVVRSGRRPAVLPRGRRPQLPFNGSREPVVNGVVPGVDKTTDYWIQLSVSDGTSTSSEAIYLEATPSPGGSVQAVITGKTKVESGAPLSLSGADSTGPAPLVYKWSAPGLSFDGSDQVSVTVTTPALTQTTEYPVQLSVTGHGGDGAQSVASVIVTVVASQDTGTWRPQDYPGGSEVTHDYRGQACASTARCGGLAAPTARAILLAQARTRTTARSGRTSAAPDHCLRLILP